MPTRIDDRTKTSSLINNIYTNISESDTDMTGVLNTHSSDHYSIFRAHKNSQFSIKRKTNFDLHFPIQHTEVKYANRNEWINNILKKEIIQTEQLFSYKKKYPTQENKEKYKKFRNQNISNLRKAERDYYQDQFELNINDLRYFWKVIKNIIQKSENKFSCNHEEVVINNKITPDEKRNCKRF